MSPSPSGSRKYCVRYLERLFVDVEDLRAEVERHAAVRPADHLGVALLDLVTLLVEGSPPAHRVLHLQLQTVGGGEGDGTRVSGGGSGSG